MKKNTTKKALLMSSLSVLLCVAMLIGTTFAWFTDTVSSGVNRIVAGNLDLEVSSKVGSDWVSIQDSTTLFSTNLWEPGHTEYVTLKVENKGTLAFNYKVMVQLVNETAGTNVNNDPFKLSDYLVFKTTTPNTIDTTPADRNAARALAGTEMKLNQAGLTQTGYILSGGDAEYITLVIYMPETVGNEANYKTGTTPPEIELGITVLASQKTEESDSFGDQYDATATFPDGLATIENINETVSAADDSFTIGNAAGTVQASGETTVGSSISLTVEPTVDNSTSVVGAVTSTGSVVAISYDIEVTGHTAGTEVTVAIYLGSGIVVNDFYHDGVAMTKVFDKGSLADGKYYFDEATGYLTFVTTSFSTFSAVVEKLVNWSQLADTSWYNTTATTFTLTSAKQLAGLASLVKNGNKFSGKKIILNNDIDLLNINWTPIGVTGKAFLGSFDGGNHTISNLYCNMPEESRVGLFGTMWQKSGGVKNLTIDNATVSGDTYVGVLIGQSGSQVVENITITGLVKLESIGGGVGCIAGYNQYGRVENVTINVDAGSYVKGYLSGGVLGHSPEGGTTTLFRKNISSNIDVYGTTHNSGGIAGISSYNVVFENCEVTGNVYLTQVDELNTKIGGIIGSWSASGTKPPITLTNCSFTGKLFVGDVEVTNPLHNGLVGDRYSSSETGSLIINGVTQ